MSPLHRAREDSRSRTVALGAFSSRSRTVQNRAENEEEDMSHTTPDVSKVVYWHRELPPMDGTVLHEHVIEATSDRVNGSIERDGGLWQRCHATLMQRATERLSQEIARLDGDFAHVLDEHVDSRRDDLTNESWLLGRFSYVLYQRAGHL